MTTGERGIVDRDLVACVADSPPHRLSYEAPWWLPGGHLQTLYAAVLAPRPRVRYRRERWETPDGDFVDVDWLTPSSSGVEEPQIVNREPSAISREPSGADGSASAGQPLLVLFHGLEGSSGSPYAQALMSQTSSLGWHGAVVHFRGCGGTPNRLPRAYHSGDTVELDWMLRRLKASASGPLYAVGVSLGANVLLKWLGEQQDAAIPMISRAAAISAPVDLMAAGEALGRGFNLLYTSAFLRTLKRKSLEKLRQHPGLYEAASVRRARTLRVFDNVVTAPLHGFRDTDDYWTRASSKPVLARIRVPTLMVNARNDPFLPETALPGADEVSACVTREFPREGGHVGFVSGAFPGNLAWLPRRVLAFLRASPLLNATAAQSLHNPSRSKDRP